MFDPPPEKLTPELVFREYAPRIYNIARRMLGNDADAEDVTQDVWLRAAGTDLQDVDDLRAWLVTVAARRSYDILKSARFRRETMSGRGCRSRC